MAERHSVSLWVPRGTFRDRPPAPNRQIGDLLIPERVVILAPDGRPPHLLAWDPCVGEPIDYQEFRLEGAPRVIGPVWVYTWAAAGPRLIGADLDYVARSLADLLAPMAESGSAAAVLVGDRVHRQATQDPGVSAFQGAWRIFAGIDWAARDYLSSRIVGRSVLTPIFDDVGSGVGPAVGHISDDYGRRADEEASQRAREALVARLTRKQRISFLAGKGFIATGEKTGMRYKIKPHGVMNVTTYIPVRAKKLLAGKLPEDALRFGGILDRVPCKVVCCLVLKGAPLYDQLLAQKTLIESDESEFLRSANWSWVN